MAVPRSLYTCLLLLVLPFVSGVLILSHRSPVGTYVDQSRALAREHQYDAAIAAIDAALALDPENPALFVERGQRILLIYEWDRALADFNHAIALWPEYPDAYYYRGVLYASVPDASAWPLAVQDFERYLTLSPNGHLSRQAQRSLDQMRSGL